MSASVQADGTSPQSAPTPSCLPYIDIQHDAMTVFDDVSQGIVFKEDIWISGYRIGSPSAHGKAKIEFEEGGGVKFTPRAGVEVDRLSTTNFLISIPALQIRKTPLRFPRQIIHPPYEKKSAISPALHINTIAHSPSSPHLAIGGPDGYCIVLSTNESSPPVSLSGHVGDVLNVKWFPSGQVVLTTSSDLSLRIFSSTTGVNPRVLKGHTRGITCSAILGVGKQVLSGSKDGSVRLWDVSKGSEVGKWITRGGKSVEGLLVVRNTNEKEVIVAATQSGDLSLHPLATPGEALATVESPISSTLVSIAYSASLGMIATGHSNGVVVLRPLEAILAGESRTATKLVKRNESPIYSVMFSDDALLVGTGAGLPCRLRVARTAGEITVEVKEEYGGWEAVGIESWTEDLEGGVWCAGENEVKRY